jgi:hypothetical protein
MGWRIESRLSWTWGTALAPVFAVAGAAAPLDKETCAKLEAEQTQLVGAGTRADMVRGAEWAKTNLPPQRLERIARLIEIDVQIAFRCTKPKPPEPHEREPAAITDPAPAHKPDAGAKPHLRKIPPPAAAPGQPAKADEPAKAPQVIRPRPSVKGPVNEPGAQPGVAPAQKPAAKSKPSDAYLPPAKAPTEAAPLRP